MKLQKLTIENFKGIKSYTIEPQGRNINIKGENGTGKTTIFDAWSYLLFDKDSNDRKDFKIKPMQNMKDVNFLETVVEGEILIADDEILTLKKVYKEKWTRKRGSQEDTFSGNETEYFINEVPIKKKDFETKINNLIPNDIFKLLSNPLFLNSMKWQDRRTLLFSQFGEVSDEAIIESNEEFEELKDILKKTTIEEHRTILKTRKKDYNKKLVELPIRIDEAVANLPDLSDLTEVELSLKKEKEDKEVLKGKIESLEIESKNIDKKNEIMDDLRKQLQKEKSEIYNEVNDEVFKIKKEKSDLGYSINRLKDEKKESEESLKSYKIKIEEVKKEWQEINTKNFIQPDVDNMICPTCKQRLSEKDIEKQLNDLKINFNKEKTNNITKINENGKIISEKIKNITKKLEEIPTEIEKLEQKLKDCKKEPDLEKINYEENSNYKKILVELNKAKEYSFEGKEKLKELKEELNKCNNKISEYNGKLGLKDIVKNTNKKIEGYQLEIKEISQKLIELEKGEFLIEDFIRVKNNVITENINKNFKDAKFLLFEDQINGGIKEYCECFYKGIPYSSLNTAGKIQVGIDIIETFNKHLNNQVPVFIDNKESVTNIKKIDSQVINLIVDGNEKTLKMEVL